MTEVEVNEEEEEWTTGEEPRQGDLDLEQGRQGREEEMNYMIKTQVIFEFGSWKDATPKAGKTPTTTASSCEVVSETSEGQNVFVTHPCKEQLRLAIVVSAEVLSFAKTDSCVR